MVSGWLSVSSLWISKSFLWTQREVTDVPAEWCHHKMSFTLIPYELQWFKGSHMYLCDRVSLSSETQVAFFFLGFHIYTTYFGNCLVCLGGCTWCACGCDCLGIPLRPVVLGERHILSLRKATKLHLWSDRGMKCHKQLLHRQPAVTMAVEPVSLWQQEHTFKEYDFSSPVCLCRNPNPKSNNTRTARKVRVLNSNGRDKKALSSGGSTDCVA